MERRKFLIGLGALSAGGAAAAGTGAFSSAEAARTTEVDVVGDGSAFLSFDVKDNDRASIANGELELDFVTGNDDDDAGLNPNAEISFREIVEVQNDGTEEVYLGIDVSEIESLSGIARVAPYFVQYNEAGEIPDTREDHSGNPENEVRIEDGDFVSIDDPRPLIEDEDDRASLDSGEAGVISFFFETEDDPDDNLADAEITFAAVTSDREQA